MLWMCSTPSLLVATTLVPSGETAMPVRPLGETAIVSDGLGTAAAPPLLLRGLDSLPAAAADCCMVHRIRPEHQCGQANSNRKVDDMFVPCLTVSEMLVASMDQSKHQCADYGTGPGLRGRSHLTLLYGKKYRRILLHVRQRLGQQWTTDEFRFAWSSFKPRSVCGKRKHRLVEVNVAALMRCREQRGVGARHPGNTDGSSDVHGSLGIEVQ